MSTEVKDRVDVEQNELGEIKEERADRIMKNIGALRKKRKLNQLELAKLIGVTQAAVSQWERGKRSPSWGDARKLSRALKCKIDDL